MKLKTMTMAAAVAGLAFIGGPAMATGNSYDVSVGGSTAAGTHPVTADTITFVEFSVKNAAGTVVNMGCDGGTVSSSAGSFVNSGTGITDIARVAPALNGCVWMGGVPHNAYTVGTGVLRGTESATSGSDDVGVRLDGFKVEFRSVIPGLCEFDLVGSLRGHLHEATGQVEFEPNGYDGSLVVENVGGCTGAFAHGDAASLEMTLQLHDEHGDPIDINLVS